MPRGDVVAAQHQLTAAFSISFQHFINSQTASASVTMTGPQYTQSLNGDDGAAPPGRFTAIAYAMDLEDREKGLRNLRIPATGIALFSGLNIISMLNGGGTCSTIAFYISLVAFFVAWAINNTDDTATTFIRQLLFVAPRVATIVFEVWLIVTLSKLKAKQIGCLVGLALAILVNLSNIVLIFISKAVFRQRSRPSYVRFTIASHCVFSLHVSIVLVIWATFSPPTQDIVVSKSWGFLS